MWATEVIPWGARVLVRGTRASLPINGASNATAPKRSWLDGPRIVRDQSFAATMDEGVTEIDLQAIADGPIMDSNMIYLPAGKLSMEETRRREAAQIIWDETP